MSPQNILVGTNGVAKVIDFGIAKGRDRATAKTSTGVLKGKVCYMPREQACGEEVDARTDTWALGAVLYYMLAGHAPYKSDSDLASLKMAITAAPIKPLPRACPSRCAPSSTRRSRTNPKPAFRRPASWPPRSGGSWPSWEPSPRPRGRGVRAEGDGRSLGGAARGRGAGPRRGVDTREPAAHGRHSNRNRRRRQHREVERHRGRRRPEQRPRPVCGGAAFAFARHDGGPRRPMRRGRGDRRGRRPRTGFERRRRPAVGAERGKARRHNRQAASGRVDGRDEQPRARGRRLRTRGQRRSGRIRRHSRRARGRPKGGPSAPPALPPPSQNASTPTKKSRDDEAGF